MADDEDTWQQGVRPVRGAGAYTRTDKKSPVIMQIRPRVLDPGPRPHDPGSDQLDGQRARDLAAGRLKVEARLDLHGLTHEAARDRFMTFILDSWAAGRRVVLVITGKGRGGVPGVLREALPGWAADRQVAGAIVRLTPAAPKDGGTGAFYLYLRRSRNGKT